MFVRNWDTTKYQYNQCTLIGFSDCLLGYSVNPATNLGNLDFFLELTSILEEWKSWLASKQELLDELIADNDYDSLNPLQRWVESRLREGLREEPLDDFSDNGDKAADKPLSWLSPTWNRLE